MSHFIKKISVYGDKIILSDGSQWLVSEPYCNRCLEWYETQGILIRELDPDRARYELVNLDSAESVEAHSVSALVQTPRLGADS